MRTNAFVSVGSLFFLAQTAACDFRNAPVAEGRPSGAGSAGAAGAAGRGGAAGGGGAGGGALPPEGDFSPLTALPVDAAAPGARVRAIAAAPNSDKAVVVYEKQLEGGGAGLYASVFDGEAFGPPAVLAGGGSQTRLVWAEFLPVSEKAVVAFDRSNGLTTEVFASVHDGETFGAPRAVSPGPRPLEPAAPGAPEAYDGSHDGFALAASPAADVAAIVLRWPSPAQAGGAPETHTWALPIGPDGLGALGRLDAALGGDAVDAWFDLPRAAFLPSGRALFCDGGFTAPADAAAPGAGVAWCVPLAEGAFGDPLVLRRDGGSPEGAYVNDVHVAASAAGERALVLFGEYAFDDVYAPRQTYAALYDGEAFGPLRPVAPRATGAQATFTGGREAFVSYRRYATSDNAFAHVVGVVPVGDGVGSPVETTAEPNCRERSPRLQRSPAGGGLLAFGASRREGTRAGCNLRASWFDGEAFAELGGLPERFGEIELRPLPRSPRVVGAYSRYDEAAQEWRLFGATISPEGGTAEVTLGRARAGDDAAFDGDVRVLAGGPSDRALVVTPAPRRAAFERAEDFATLDRAPREAAEASASLFDGTDFAPLARVGKCPHAAVLGASGRFLFVCEEDGVTAKIVE